MACAVAQTVSQASERATGGRILEPQRTATLSCLEGFRPLQTLVIAAIALVACTFAASVSATSPRVEIGDAPASIQTGVASSFPTPVPVVTPGAARSRPWLPIDAPPQVFAQVNATFRINASLAEDRDTAQVSDGVLLSAELSWTPKASNDIVYINPFWAIDTYTQAGREPIVGGPLATFGILFASSNIGDLRSELSAGADEVAGAVIGYQAFWDQFRRNLVLELAGRKDTSGNAFDSAALGLQLQQKYGRRVLVQLEGFVAAQEGRNDAFGGRTEVLIQF